MRRFVAAAISFALAFAVPASSARAAAQSWPRTFEQSGATVVVYQPQVRSWPNYTVLNGLAAVALTQAGASTPIYGVLNFTTYTSADFASGQVQLVGTKVTSVNWPNEDATTAANLTAIVEAIPLQNNVVPLAMVLASLHGSQVQPRVAPVSHTPPKIFYTEGRAILVVFDRDPILAPIKGTNLTFAVNTNWAVIHNPGDNRYYLLDGDNWISATSALGPWAAATAPASFSKIPDDASWKDVRAHLNAPKMAAADVPKVFVSTTPADMIAIAGKPNLVSIAGTLHLQYVSNTGNNLFFDTKTGQWYVLLSGRWFRATGLAGPWTFASDSLPGEFALIPVNSPRGNVLVSVPGTVEAQYAGASLQVPQIATVNPATTKLTVTYAGSPQFQPIAGTSLYYAVNTGYDVIKVADGQYYACYSGVWFFASAPNGPWSVAYWLPPAISTIPPSSPLYGDTYVYIYNSQGEIVTAPPPNYDATAAILVGFTAGYTAAYWSGAWVYGTGYYYPGYVAYGAYPVYYPYAATWTGGSYYGGATYSSYYNSHTGYYGNQASYYGPYGGATAKSAYNPTTGTYARGGAVYGPAGGEAGAASFYNPRYGVSGTTEQEKTPYGSWGETQVHTQNGNAYGAHQSGANGSAAGVSTSHGSSSVAKTNNGDVYAGHDGNVYRNQDGSWQKSTGNGGWSDVQSPSSADHSSTSSSSSSYHPPSNTSSSSYHPSSSSASSYHPSGDEDLDRDASARSAGSSGFHGGFGGGGGRR